LRVGGSCSVKNARMAPELFRPHVRILSAASAKNVAKSGATTEEKHVDPRFPPATLAF
jgi:hypothetical protein